MTFYGLTKYSILAGVSISVIASIISYSSLLAALIFYFVFKETLNKQHLIGMIILIACVMCIAMGKASAGSSENDGNEYVSIIIPILFALQQGVNYTVNSLITRFAYKRGFKPL